MSGVQTISVAPDDGESRLDRWFRRHFPNLGHGRLEKLLRTGQVRVDGKRAQAGDRVAPGQMIRVPPLGAAPPAVGGSRPSPPIRDRDAAAIRACVIYRDVDGDTGRVDGRYAAGLGAS